MTKDNVIQLKKPEPFPEPFIGDPITDILRSGARKLLAEALEAEIDIFLPSTETLKMIKIIREWSVTGIFLREIYKQGLARYPSKRLVLGIEGRIKGQIRFDIIHPYCPVI